MQALAEALGDASPADQRHVLQWTASRAMLGIAHAEGIAEAASFAYRLADTLAGSVQ